MEVVARSTQYVTGTPGGSGDPSPLTAFGVWTGMKAVAAELWGDDSLHGRHVAVQGLGKVGAGVVRHLVSEGAQVTVADVNSALAESISQETGVEIAGPEEIVSAQCDILAPCALGGVVNDKTIPLLRTSAIAGAANNQLERPEHGRALANMGILYAPDYVINAGGLINVEDELHGYDRSRARLKAAAIGDRLRLIFDRAASAGVSTAEAADEIAQERIASARETQGRRGVSLPDRST
jgi:leucine dehydrogenase